MYVFHLSIEAAHEWEHFNPEWKPVSFCIGHVTGSILVLYELVPKVPQETVAEHKPVVSVYPSGKRRGRPPKVTYAIGK